MSIAFDIATYIQNTGALATIGTDMGVNAFLDSADNGVAVFEYPGEPDTKAHGGTVDFENFSIQLQVRNTGSSAGYSLCYSIYAFLRGKKDFTVNSHVYNYVEGTRLPFLLTRDEKDRRVWIAELRGQRKPE